MKIYLDYVFLLNFSFDFLLLLTVSIILRRNVSIIKIILGALVGGSSIFLLFFSLNSIELFLYKIGISILMVLVAFRYKNIKYTIKNISYLYLTSTLLGGVLYLLNIQFSYNHEGIVFYHNGFSINCFLIIITTPIILYTYIKQTLNLKNKYSKYHKVNIQYQNQKLKLTAFLDTGNQLIDPITKIPIIIIEEKYIKNINNFMIVPYHTISGFNMLRCIKIDEIEIDGKVVHKKALLGFTKKLNMEGIECILNPKLMEENYD